MLVCNTHCTKSTELFRLLVQLALYICTTDQCMGLNMWELETCSYSQLLSEAKFKEFVWSSILPFLQPFNANPFPGAELILNTNCWVVSLQSVILCGHCHLDNASIIHHVNGVVDNDDIWNGYRRKVQSVLSHLSNFLPIMAR